MLLLKRKKQAKKKLKDLLAKADELFLATDEDREEESISWHLLDVLKPKVPVKRLAFQIQKQLSRQLWQIQGKLDSKLVETQETRRYLITLWSELSPLLWRKIAPKLSGRVKV